MGKSNGINKKGVKRLLIIILLILIVVAIVVVINVRKNKGENNNQTQNTNVNINEEKKANENESEEETVVVTPSKPSIEGNEYVQEQDGIKINTSNNLKKDKTFGIFTFTDIRIETDDSGSAIIATVSAKSSVKTESKTVNIKILNNKKEVVAELGGYIGQIKPGETITFRAETSTDITNAYDFTIE